MGACCDQMSLLSQLARLTSLTACLAAPVVLAGCDDGYTEPSDAQLEARVLVGEIEGTDIALAVLVDGDDISVYQCGDEDNVDTETRWYHGTIGTSDDPDAFDLEAETEDGRITGRRSADGLEGEVELSDGTIASFRVEGVADDAEAGVYLAQDGDLSTGVIVRGEGDALEFQGATCDQVACFQVIILAPIAIDGGRFSVQADTGGTALDTVVERVLAPL